MKKNFSGILARKVMLSLFTASVMSTCVMGTASASYNPFNKDSYDKVFSGTEVLSESVTYGNVDVTDGASVTANAAFNASFIRISCFENGSTVNLNGGGTIDGRLEDDRAVALMLEGEKTVLNADGVDFIGEICLERGAKLTINGGSVTSGDYYYQNQDGEFIKNGYTDLGTSGGTIVINNAEINSNIGVFGSRTDGYTDSGLITINNSNINAPEGILAGWGELSDGSIIGGTLILNGSDNNIYTASGYVIADRSGKIIINGGTLKAPNLRELMYGYKYIDEDDGSEQVATSVDGGIVLDKDGKIETMTDQIFDLAASGNAQADDPVTVTNTGISYVGGTLVFDDLEYTQAYVDNAKDALLAYQPESKTDILMMGALIDNSGEEITEITVQDAEKNGEETNLNGVTVTTGGNLLAGSDKKGEVEGLDIRDNVEKGFQASVLQLAAGSEGVVITNASKVTLGGNNGGSVVKIAGAEDKQVKIVVGTAEAIPGVSTHAGILNIGLAAADAATEYLLNGKVTVNKDSVLNTNGQTAITGGIELNSGAVHVASGVLRTESLAVAGTSSITGSAAVASLKGDKEAVLNIGSQDKAGDLNVAKAVLNGATVFLDHAWKDNGTISDASGLSVTDAEALDGNYIVGQNSLLSLGAERAEAEAVFSDSGLSWGQDDVTAAVYVAGNIDAANSSLTVDGSLSEGAALPNAAMGTVSFAANSLLMVNGEKIYGDEAAAAISGISAATVADSAKLVIGNASQEGTYKVLAGSDLGDGWSEENITFANQLVSLDTIDNNDDHFAVTAKSLTVKAKYGDAVIVPNIVDKTRADYPDTEAAAFFNAAVDNTVNASEAQQISALNSAGTLSELAGVAHSTYSVSGMLTDSVAEHMSLAKPLEHDTDIWARYVHNKENISGLSTGGSGAAYDAQYNGIVVGADLYKKGKAVLGVALAYVDGNISGHTVSAVTDNDAEYYGLSLYGGIENKDSAVTGDISYLHGKHDITQINSGCKLTGAPKSDAFSIGLRAEKSFKVGASKFVPYAGLRYMRLGTGNYSSSLGMSYDAEDADLWLLPVGVKYSAEYHQGGWIVRPVVEAGYVWTMGDRSGRQTVSLNGTSDGFGYDVADSGSYIGRLALEAAKHGATYGLAYEYQKGDSVKSNKWMVNLNWQF